MTQYSKLLSQIINYFKDKLSNKERHSLEKDIHADPFLSDAMDGFSKLSPNELENDLLALTERLNNKTQPKTNKKLYLYLSVAASAVVLIGIGVLYFNFESKNNQVAQELNKKENELKSDSNQTSTQSNLSQKLPLDSSSIQTTSAPQSDALLTQRSSVKKESKEKNSIAKTSKRTHKKQLQKNSKPSTGPIMANNITKEPSLAEQTIKIKGVIKGDEDYDPLPGASVNIKGTSVGSISGFEGEYEIEAKSGDTLVYSFVGFESKEVVVANDMTSTTDITLDNQAALQEVVVVSDAIERKKQTTGAVSTVTAESFSEKEIVASGVTSQERKRKKLLKAEKKDTYTPKGGFRRFHKYIKKNKRIDQNNRLEIQAELTISIDGAVNQVRIISPCSKEIQAEVIRLLQEGPVWKRKIEEDNNTSNKVSITIKL